MIYIHKWQWDHFSKKEQFLYVNSLSLSQFINHLNEISISDIDKSFYDLSRWWDKVEWNGSKFTTKNNK